MHYWSYPFREWQGQHEVAAGNVEHTGGFFIGSSGNRNNRFVILALPLILALTLVLLQGCLWYTIPVLCMHPVQCTCIPLAHRTYECDEDNAPSCGSTRIPLGAVAAPASL